MPKNITPIEEFTSPISVPVVGDLPESYPVTVEEMIQALANRTAYLEANLPVVTTLAALKALAAGRYNRLFLAGRTGVLDGGHGHFYWVAGDQSANVANDPGAGVWVPPDSDMTGVGGAWKRTFDGPLNVLWFGAVGDGVADDATAVQNAINYAWAASISDIYLPTGTYLVTGLKVYSDTTYRGAGPKQTFIKSTTDAPIIASANYTGYNGVSAPTGDMIIRDLSVSGSDNSLDTSQVGILVRDYYSKIMNVWVLAAGSHGIQFTDLNSTGTTVGGTLVENHILDVELFNNNGDGINYGPANNNKLTDAHMRNLIINVNASSNYGIYVGSGAGVSIDQVHVYGTPAQNGIRIDNGFNANLSNIYVEAATAASVELSAIQKHINLTNLHLDGAVGVRATGGGAGSNVVVQIANMTYDGAGTVIEQVAGASVAHVFAVNVTKRDAAATWKAGSNIRITNDLSYIDGEAHATIDNGKFDIPVGFNAAVNTTGAQSIAIPIRLSGTFRGLSGMLTMGLRSFHNGAVRVQYAGMITLIQKDSADAPAILLTHVLHTGAEFLASPAIAISAGTGPGDYTLTLSLEAANADARGALAFTYTPA
jgi:hypothetical protein